MRFEEETMADETKPAPEPTAYRVLKKMEDAGELVLLDGTTEVGFELFALLPDRGTGNVVKAAAEKYGGGEYVQVAVSSFQRKPVTIDSTPRIKIG